MEIIFFLRDREAGKVKVRLRHRGPLLSSVIRPCYLFALFHINFAFVKTGSECVNENETLFSNI
jgi:hypothetical protein